MIRRVRDGLEAASARLACGLPGPVQRRVASLVANGREPLAPDLAVMLALRRLHARFPAAVEDARAVVGWALRSAPLVGADPARVAVGGDSAGGMLAAVVSRLEIAWFHRHYLSGATRVRRDDPRLVPLRPGDHSGLPPAVIVTASHDPLRDEGEAYAVALAAAGTPVRLRRLDGLVHGFVHLGALSRSARDAVAEIASLLRTALDADRHQIRSDVTAASKAGRSRSK